MAPCLPKQMVSDVRQDHLSGVDFEGFAVPAKPGGVAQGRSCEAGLPGLRRQVAADMDRQETTQMVGEYWA